jgi:chemotaxis response regulator CheB
MSTALPLPPIRVVLAHLPRLTRDLISRTLKDEPAIDVVREVTDAGRSARQLIDETDADLVIVGAEKPGLLAEYRELLDERAPLRVLAVSSDGREARLYGVRPYEVILCEFSCDSVLELASNRPRNSRTAHRAAESNRDSTSRKVRR